MMIPPDALKEAQFSNKPENAFLHRCTFLRQMMIFFGGSSLWIFDIQTLFREGRGRALLQQRVALICVLIPSPPFPK